MGIFKVNYLGSTIVFFSHHASDLTPETLSHFD